MHTGPKQSKEIERRLCGRETEEADDQVGRRQSAGRGRHIKCGARLYCVHNPGHIEPRCYLYDLHSALPVTLLKPMSPMRHTSALSWRFPRSLSAFRYLFWYE